MTIHLRTRSDFKKAGRAMALEAVKLLSEHFASVSIERLRDPEFIDGCSAKMIEAMELTAQDYLRQGFPHLWVAKFRTAFLLTAGTRCRELQLMAACPAAGHT